MVPSNGSVERHVLNNWNSLLFHTKNQSLDFMLHLSTGLSLGNLFLVQTSVKDALNLSYGPACICSFKKGSKQKQAH